MIIIVTLERILSSVNSFCNKCIGFLECHGHPFTYRMCQVIYALYNCSTFRNIISNLYIKYQFLCPLAVSAPPSLQVIMPSTACEGGKMTKLFKLILDQLPSVNVATVQRKYFNENKGHF